MADFFQNGMVTTLHNLDADGAKRMERQLLDYSTRTGVALVLPALYSEFERPAMLRIINELRGVRFLRRIIVALGQASESQYQHARSFFEGFRTPVSVIQVDHPRILGLFDTLAGEGLDAGSAGKGRSCWLAYGYALAKGDCDVIALHDCDITTYKRDLLVRLCFPLMHPNLDFEFCKGYYARRSDRLHGRVTRLLLTPLLRAIRKMQPDAVLPAFIDSFRYALAGEFSMRSQFARVSRIPSDWGLEIGVLAEVHRNCAAKRICQVDLTDNYDHKHQSLCPDTPGRGLRKMATDIATALLRALAAEGIVMGDNELRTLRALYVQMAEDMGNRYEADAIINGLVYNRHSEETAVAAFQNSLSDAASMFLQDPLGSPCIPSWARVHSALPDFATELDCTVADTDRAGAGRLVTIVPHKYVPVTRISQDPAIAIPAAAAQREYSSLAR